MTCTLSRDTQKSVCYFESSKRELFKSDNRVNEKNQRNWPKIDHFRTSKIDPQVLSKTAIISAVGYSLSL
jgi:hypothetical protein